MTCRFEEANTTVLQYKSSWQSHNFILRFLTIVAINSHVWLTHEWNVIEKLIPVLPLFIWSVFLRRNTSTRNLRFCLFCVGFWINAPVRLLIKPNASPSYILKYCVRICQNSYLTEFSWALFTGLGLYELNVNGTTAEIVEVRSTCQHDRKK